MSLNGIQMYVLFIDFFLLHLFVSQLFSLCLLQKGTVLMKACRKGFKSICNVLVQRGADVSLKDNVSIRRDCGTTLLVHDKQNKVGPVSTKCRPNVIKVGVTSFGILLADQVCEML